MDGELLNTDIVAARLGIGDWPDRTAYWQGELIAIDWTTHSAWWEFLWELATVSESKIWLGETRFGDSVSWVAINNRKSDMVKTAAFPGTLDDEIEAGDDPHGYRLKLARDKIHRFCVVDGKLEPASRRQ